MKILINSFIRNESGAVAIEYGLIAGLISVVLIVGVQFAGTKVSGQFSAVASKLN